MRWWGIWWDMYDDESMYVWMYEFMRRGQWETRSQKRRTSYIKEYLLIRVLFSLTHPPTHALATHPLISKKHIIYLFIYKLYSTRPSSPLLPSIGPYTLNPLFPPFLSFFLLPSLLDVFLARCLPLNVLLSDMENMKGRKKKDKGANGEGKSG